MALKVDNVDAMVWCRNSDYGRYTTPCSEIKCKFKDKKTDVKAGIGKCGRFQLTLPSGSWEWACHLKNDLSFVREV